MAGSAEHDREWVERFRKGDRDAFVALYRAHYPAVFRYAWHMTGDRIQALELTQDVFVWLIHHPSDFDPERGGLAAFLGGVARKMRLRQRRDHLKWTPWEEPAAAPASSPLAFDEVHDVAALQKAIASLPEKYREPVVLCDLEEKSYQEAAALLECATGTVRSRLHRARALLARKLRPVKEDQVCRK